MAKERKENKNFQGEKKKKKNVRGEKFDYGRGETTGWKAY